MGLAKAAELNFYPGPAHVLELAAGLGLTPDQVASVSAIRQRMSAAAKPLGAQILTRERQLDRQFAEGRINAIGAACRDKRHRRAAGPAARRPSCRPSRDKAGADAGAGRALRRLPRLWRCIEPASPSFGTWRMNRRSATEIENAPKRIAVRLDALDAATDLKQLNRPGFDFHPLRGNRSATRSTSTAPGASPSNRKAAPLMRSSLSNIIEVQT